MAADLSASGASTLRLKVIRWFHVLSTLVNVKFCFSCSILVCRLTTSQADVAVTVSLTDSNQVEVIHLTKVRENVSGDYLTFSQLLARQQVVTDISDPISVKFAFNIQSVLVFIILLLIVCYG